MKEELIQEKTFKLAREKGFIPERKLINQTISILESGDRLSTNGLDLSEKNKKEVVPTQSSLQKWLREKHKIHIVVISDSKDRFFTDYRFSDQRVDQDEDLVLLTGKVFKSYEEALEISLQEGLKLIKIEEDGDKGKQ